MPHDPVSYNPRPCAWCVREAWGDNIHTKDVLGGNALRIGGKISVPLTSHEFMSHDG